MEAYLSYGAKSPNLPGGLLGLHIAVTSPGGHTWHSVVPGTSCLQGPPHAQAHTNAEQMKPLPLPMPPAQPSLQKRLRREQQHTEALTEVRASRLQSTGKKVQDWHPHPQAERPWGPVSPL
jgi:hypothetical protein